MIRNICKHLWLVMRHKHAVFVHCFKCGIPLRGILHDLSKFSPVEFSESAKYFHGGRSPLAVCREERGLSLAWLHHKGRNRHHLEYWVDEDCKIPPLVPYKFAVECVCDKLAATKIYRGKSYTPEMALAHFRRYGNKVHTNERSLAFIDKVFSDLCELGEKEVLNKKYMKKTYREICLSDKEN